MNDLITPPEKALLEEQEKDGTPLLMNNLVNPSEKYTPQDIMECKGAKYVRGRLCTSVKVQIVGLLLLTCLVMP